MVHSVGLDNELRLLVGLRGWGCVTFKKRCLTVFFSVVEGLGRQAEPEGGVVPSAQPVSRGARPSERSR